MIPFLIYIIKVSICMLLAFLPYQLFMRRSSFFIANRFWLLSTLVLSFIIPLIKISVTHVTVSIPSEILNGWMDEGTLVFTNTPVQSKGIFLNFDWMLLLPYLYFLVSFFLLFRFSISLFRFYRTYRRSEIIRQNKMIILVSEIQRLPFSFFRFVFLSRSDFENENSHLILIHEQAHLRSLHSLDLLFLEILQLIFWINPLIIIYRRALRLQHEYQVDKIVLQKTNDYSGYLYSLAKVVSNGLYAGISNGFYCSTLKKRIHMIGYKTSRKIAAIRYVIIFPLAFLMLIAFTRPETKKFFTILVPLHIIQTEPADVPSIVPIDESKAKYSAGWGDRIHPVYKIKMFHHGADWIAPTGTEVYATADGIIEKVEFNEGGYGKEVVIRHSKKLSTQYAHLSAFAVKLNDTVKKGQVIGYVGSSGRSTTPHLHYEVRLNNQDVDPGKYFKLSAQKGNGETFD